MEVAFGRGCERASLEAFLAGLAILPPPVPVDDHAQAHGLERAAVESFAADLAPLLDKTALGIIFRDEPTETYVRKHDTGEKFTLRAVAERLLEMQEQSVFAASTLPDLYRMLGDGQRPSSWL